MSLAEEASIAFNSDVGGSSDTSVATNGTLATPVALDVDLELLIQHLSLEVFLYTESESLGSTVSRLASLGNKCENLLDQQRPARFTSLLDHGGVVR